MAKRGLAVAAAVVVVAAVAAGSWLWLGKPQRGPVAGYLDEVPADTLYFSGSLEAPPAAAYLGSPAMISSYRDMAILAYHQYRVKAQAAADGESTSTVEEMPPEGALTLSLVDDLLTTFTSYDANPFPVNKSKPVALFGVGMMPVLRFEAESDALVSYFDGLGKKAGMKIPRQSLDGIDYLKVPLVSGDKSLDLLVVTSAGRTRLALSSSALPPTMLPLLLGAELPAESLAERGTIDNLRQQLKLTPYSVSYVAVNEMVRALVAPQQNLFGQQLQAVAGPAFGENLAEWQSASCATEVMALADQMPGLAGGFTEIRSDDEAVHLTGVGGLLLTNGKVREQLARMQGFVPAITTTLTNPAPMVAVGYGINSSELAPAVQELWKLFTAASYSCAPLEELRADAAEQNPGMIAAATSMVNGLQGVYAVVNDLRLDSGNAEMPVAGADLLVGLTATSPRTLWNMSAAFNPLTKTMSWPVDDQPVAVPMPEGWPATVPVWLKASGQQAMLYTGERAAAQASQISAETVTSNAFLSMMLDYAAIAGVADQAVAMVAGMHGEGGDGTDCAIRAQLESSWGTLNMAVHERVFVAEPGLMFDASVNVPVATATTAAFRHQVEGDYTTARLGVGCQPTADGHESFAAAGTSHYRSQKGDASCVDYEATGKWQRQGNVLVWHYQQERWSDEDAGCIAADTAWNSEISEPVETCLMLHQQDDGFDCLYASDDEPFVIRYRRATN